MVAEPDKDTDSDDFQSRKSRVFPKVAAAEPVKPIDTAVEEEDGEPDEAAEGTKQDHLPGRLFRDHTTSLSDARRKCAALAGRRCVVQGEGVFTFSFDPDSWLCTSTFVPSKDSKQCSVVEAAGAEAAERVLSQQQPGDWTQRGCITQCSQLQEGCDPKDFSPQVIPTMTNASRSD
eukprot:scaffold382557_cov40-Prasinocladus_malaysianus.AAC.1